MTPNRTTLPEPPGVSPPTSSPATSIAELPITNILRPQDIYYDARNTPLNGASRFVRAPNVVQIPGTLSKSTNADNSGSSRCAITWKDYLKIVRIQDPSVSSPFSPPNAPPLKRSSKFILGKGPGNATIIDESSVRLGTTKASTDVGWGYGKYSNKIAVTTLSGDVVLVDSLRSGLKVEHTTREHTRAITAVRFTNQLTNYFGTASTDGYVKLWDLRAPGESTMSLDHRSPVRTLCFSPTSSSSLHAVVALENGAIFKWDIRQGALGLVDRVTVAHRGAILGMDWLNDTASNTPSDNKSGGWLCTGGLDKTVKVWDMSTSMLAQTPVHVCHTAENIKRVFWRPGFDCEVAVVPSTAGISPTGIGSGPGGSIGPGDEQTSKTADADRIEIWDIRRGWISKYVLDGGDGAVSDMTWSDSGALWALYKNGSFIQHDLRDSYRPLDGISRSAISWEASGNVTFGTEALNTSEIPFDDIKPNLKHQLVERGFKEKSPADPDYTPANQTVATVSIPNFDLEAFVDMARSYTLPGSSQSTASDLCLVNSNVAFRASQYRAAQTWMMMHSLLNPIAMPPPPVPPPSTQPPLVTLPQTSAPLISSPLAAPPQQLYGRRTLSANTIPQVNPHTPSSSKFPNSSSNSPSSENKHKYPFPTPPLPSISMSRRSSTGTKSTRDMRGTNNLSSSRRRRGSRSIDRNSRSRSRGLNSSRASSRHVGDGALGDSDDDSASSDDGALGLGMVTSPSSTPSRNRYNPITRGHHHTGSTASSSINPHNNLDIYEESEEAKLSSRRSFHQDSVSRPFHQSLLRSPEASDDAGALGDDNYNSSSSSGRDSPPPQVPPSSPLDRTAHLPLLTRPHLTKQDSRSSIKTAVPSRPKADRSKSSRPTGLSGPTSSDNDTEGTKKGPADTHDYTQLMSGSSSTEGERDGRRPGQPSPASNSPISVRRSVLTRRQSGNMTIPPIDEGDTEHDDQRRYSSSQRDSRSRRASMDAERTDLDHSAGTGALLIDPGDAAATLPLEEGGLDRGRTGPQSFPPIDLSLVREEEARMRKLGWSALRETLEYYSDRGDSQMCTMLAAVGREELLPGDELNRLEWLASSYVDLLARLRLHTSAAYVRKYSGASDLKNATNLNTTVYTSCARCKKALNRPATNQQGPTPTETTAPPGRAHNSQPTGQPLSQVNTKPDRLKTTNGVLANDDARNTDGLVPGGFGYCAKCRRTASKCAICRLPVHGLHFYCPGCSHGGHTECYQRYYLRRPMVTLPDVFADRYGTPGNFGWGLTAGCETSGLSSASSVGTVSESPFGNYSLGAPTEDPNHQRDSDIAEHSTTPDSSGPVGLTAATMGLVGLGLGVSSSTPIRDKEREKERERDKEKDREHRDKDREKEVFIAQRRKVMGHPCAAGCGHVCWAANDMLLAPP